MNIQNLKQAALLNLKERGINPNSKSAYELWFRHFDGDIQEIISHANSHNGDILPWLYDTAEVVADPSTEYADASAIRLARKLLKQFA
jgi:hypothetical protein